MEGEREGDEGGEGGEGGGKGGRGREREREVKGEIHIQNYPPPSTLNSHLQYSTLRLYHSLCTTH